MDPLRTPVSRAAADQHIEEYIRYLSSRAMALSVTLTTEWAIEFPKKPGVYVVFDREAVIYVGETGSLWTREGSKGHTQSHLAQETWCISVPGSGRVPGG